MLSHKVDYFLIYSVILTKYQPYGYSYVQKAVKYFFWFQFSPPEGHLTPKWWAPLNPARRDDSFNTLQSPIGLMVPEILSAGKIPEEQQQEQQQQQQEEEQEEEYNRFI